MQLKIDLHVHTHYSCDGVTTLKEVVAFSRKRGLDGVAITDHDVLKGALQLLSKKDIIVIPGVEVSTSRGHVLALNVSTPIPVASSPKKTIKRIHEAGGIAVAPHPINVYKKGLGGQATSTLVFDAVEVVNSSSFPFYFSTWLCRRLAERGNFPQTAGSDSHIPETIGLAYTVIDSDPEIGEIVQAIKRRKTILQGGPVPWMKRFQTLVLTQKKKRGVKIKKTRSGQG